MITIANMGGIAPKITPDLLPENIGQTANNVILHNGGVAPLSSPVTVATPTKAGAATTIYRFGKNQPETQYWFKWSNVVNVAAGPVAGDTEEKTYFTGFGIPQKTKFDLATQSGTDYPMASYNLKVPAPTTLPTLSRIAGTGPVVTETRAYVYTFVTAWGEESAPSPAELITVAPGEVVRLSALEAMPSGQYSWSGRRIYRSVTSSSGTNYYHVATLGAGTTTFDDTVPIESIGEPLPTLDWDMPPDDLKGLIAHPSGAMWGFSGKDICPSVIGAPYAWPEKYRLTCNYNPVALATMGQGVIVLTDAFPYLINSGDPESAQMVRLDDEQACVSARSVVQFGGGVVYASPDGLMSITQGGVKNLTEQHFDRKAWQALGPANLFGVKHDNRYYGFFATGGFILDTAGNFTTHDITATSAYVDPVLDQLYIAVGTNIQKWDAGSAKTHTWKSKRWNFSAPFNFPFAKVKANSFSNLTFRLYVDGVMVREKVVTSHDPFRLPRGFKGRRYEVEILGIDHWTLAAVGSLQELKNV